jgi:tRNA A-37 threonylcarbamoyl transferase component Bud32
MIERLLGHGAMGAVYAARDPHLDRTVAVKLLRASALSDEARQEMRSRLLREAQAMARLSHPEVITVHDVGAFGDQLFVAMEYVDGGTLRQWRAARHRSVVDILGVYERAGSGLAAAHEAGLVHRDFKADNVLIGSDGRVRVTDFGLARSVPGAGAATPGIDSLDSASAGASVTATLTRTGVLVGTPAYMAPEQLRGGSADARSDVFSFSVSLYEALYGERPFNGSTLPALRDAIERGDVRPAPILSSVPRWVRGALLRGLRAEPQERFESMRALLDALRAGFLQARRRSRAAVGVGGMAAVATVVAVAGATARQPASARREAAASSSQAPHVTATMAIEAGVAPTTAVTSEPSIPNATLAASDLALPRGPGRVLSSPAVSGAAGAPTWEPGQVASASPPSVPPSRTVPMRAPTAALSILRTPPRGDESVVASARATPPSPKAPPAFGDNLSPILP